MHTAAPPLRCFVCGWMPQASHRYGGRLMLGVMCQWRLMKMTKKASKKASKKKVSKRAAKKKVAKRTVSKHVTSHRSSAKKKAIRKPSGYSTN